MTELSFLIDLIIHEELPATAKEKILARVTEVEQGYILRPAVNAPFVQGSTVSPNMQQSPSTLAAMQRHAMGEQAVPMDQVQNTIAVVGALQARDALIAQATTGKPIPGATGPKKFRGQL